MNPEKGREITGIAEAEMVESVRVFHAGTAVDPVGRLVTAGGRVLDVVATGATLDHARERAMQAADLIKFEGKQYRTDIGVPPKARQRTHRPTTPRNVRAR